MNQEQAELLAIDALGWLASNEEVFPVFLGATGLGIDDLKQAAGTPETLAGILDFICQSDEWVLDFAGAKNIRPEEIMAARAALPGGDQPHWT